jgi:molybdopterin/thiamine biosynthesis adenylyltransferase
VPEGARGARELRSARVLVIGAGALGSAAAGHLTASGVGLLGLVDSRDVALSDLRSVPMLVHADVGRSKVEALAGKLGGNSPDVQVDVYPAVLDADNAEAIIAGHDLVLDCSSSAETRVAAAEACAELEVPLVAAAATGSRAAVTAIRPSGGPCERCAREAFEAVRPDAGAEAERTPGPLAGVVGSIQAAEAIKLLTGSGVPLVGRVVTIDLLRQAFGEVVVDRRPDCRVCGDA